MSTKNDFHFSLRLSGDQFTPENIKVGELSDYLDAIDKLYREVVHTEFPSQPIEDIKLSLFELKPGSLELVFAPELKEPGLSAYKKAVMAIKEYRYEYFTTGGLEALRYMANFSTRHRVNTEFRNGGTRSRVLAVIPPGTNIEPFPRLTGETTLYGKVLRVGGKEPTVTIEFNGGSLTCDVETESLAVDLATRLYQEVGLLGKARWSARDQKLVEFKVTGMTHYEEGSYLEALSQISRQVGRYFADINDVEAFVEELRDD